MMRRAKHVCGTGFVKGRGGDKEVTKDKSRCFLTLGSHA